jgi:putative transposase
MPGAVDVATEVLDTIWELPDELWHRIEPILKQRYPPAVTGRPRADLRRVLDGVVFRMRSGCQWNRMPERFGDDATIHRWFQRFVRDGVLEEIWASLVRECDELGAVDWQWQAADGCLGKSRFSGEKRAPTRLTERNPAPRKA